jgi:L-iditol 2-dehydrogenase
MKLARYVGAGRVEIQDAPDPFCPPGGLVVRTEASGLCSGELMDWYMDQKAPHVLGHEVAGIVVESQDERFPVGSRVAPHHHAPCGACDECRRGAAVHCPTWKRTGLDPGGMAEKFAVPCENLADTWLAADLRAVDAALVEPLGCVAKMARRIGLESCEGLAVVGLGAMGLLHLIAFPGAVGYDVNPARLDWARRQGLDARPVEEARPADAVVVCPGTEDALAVALRTVRSEGTVGLFAPMPPGAPTPVDLHGLYFRDVSLVPSYSCGPEDTCRAVAWLREGRVRAEQVVSEFVTLDELPRAYEAMKAGETVKAMVVFD